MLLDKQGPVPSSPRSGRSKVPKVPSEDEGLARLGDRHHHGIGEI